MTTKPVTKTLTTKKKAPRTKKTPLAKQDKQSDNEHYAKVSLSPATMSAVLSQAFTSQLFPDTSIADVANALRDKITRG